MSRFISNKHSALKEYVPGEQPKNRKYIKLNTNESPFPPSKSVFKAVTAEVNSLQLYSDPECTELNKAAAEYFGVTPDRILMTNGSDEILNFVFMAYGDAQHPFAFPDITYGFYPVFAQLNGIPFKTIPLKDDLSIDVNDYKALGMNIVIANPNAPTGICLSLSQIESIVASNPENVVVVDEAYIDFGGESAVGLTDKYDNLLVTRTFSKSFSMAGARLGFGIGCSELIADLNRIKYSTNPYNVNRMTMAAGTAALKDADYYLNNCKIIIKNREWTAQSLKELGFKVIDSKANFIFAKHPNISGEALYLRLKEKGILIRHFTTPSICEYNRISIGTKEQMKELIDSIKLIIEDEINERK